MLPPPGRRSSFLDTQPAWHPSLTHLSWGRGCSTPPWLASVFAAKVTASGTGSKTSLSLPSESLLHSHPNKMNVCSPAAQCQTPGLDPDLKDRFSFSMCSPDFCPFYPHPGSHPGCSFYDSARTTLENTSLSCDMTDDVPLHLCCLHRSQTCHQNPCCWFMIHCRIQINENREKNMRTIGIESCMECVSLRRHSYLGALTYHFFHFIFFPEVHN